MRYTGLSDMEEILVQIIRRWPLEVRLLGLTTEQLLKGLTAEEILRGLPAPERARLLKLLQDESSGSTGGGQDK